NLNTLDEQIIEIMETNFGLASDVFKLGGKYYLFKMISNTTPTNCPTAIEIRRYNSNYTLDTTVAICNSITLNSGYNFYYTATAIKLSDSKFTMVARAHDQNSLSIRQDDIAHL